MSVRVSPFHAGERRVQRQAGVADEAEAVGRIFASTLSPAVARFLPTQRLVVAATVDAEGRPWASLLTGPPGFLAVIDDALLHVAATPAADDPLTANLKARPEVGLLVIDLGTRQRIRVNGRGLLTAEGVWVEPDQVYGNCPKYIQKRRIVGEDGRTAAAALRSSRLTSEQRDAIARADTFFIASVHPEGGADASHRGGRPGFVRVLDDRRLSFLDYAGNNMFNTLGNLLEYPRAGLLFPDFETGDLLHLTGSAQIEFEPERRVLFEVEEVAQRPEATRLRWELVEPSPVNP